MPSTKLLCSPRNELVGNERSLYPCLFRGRQACTCAENKYRSSLNAQHKNKLLNLHFTFNFSNTLSGSTSLLFKTISWLPSFLFWICMSQSLGQKSLGLIIYFVLKVRIHFWQFFVQYEMSAVFANFHKIGGVVTVMTFLSRNRLLSILYFVLYFVKIPRVRIGLSTVILTATLDYNLSSCSHADLLQPAHNHAELLSTKPSLLDFLAVRHCPVSEIRIKFWRDGYLIWRLNVESLHPWDWSYLVMQCLWVRPTPTVAVCVGLSVKC